MQAGARFNASGEYISQQAEQLGERARQRFFESMGVQLIPEEGAGAQNTEHVEHGHSSPRIPYLPCHATHVKHV